MDSYQEKSAQIIEALSQIKIVPVLALETVADGLKICELFDSMGLNAAEITFRTKAAPEIIKEVCNQFPALTVGAGTVLNTADLHRAFAVGAKFAVAPGFNPTILKEAVKSGYAFSPGVCTPSEVEQAYELGATLLKFFPAEAAGGTAMLKSIIAPYRHLGIKFMPTGGITEANAGEYLSIPEVAAVGGTWLGKSADIAAGKWDKITDNIKNAVELAKKHSSNI
ncbi:MAG: bifunctional 4-hydroxy-2-oxoglutarate aldolase/2-dehydro-3-deoxy-phosphogluconate aldolase [Victivallaceae bacterium]|nr:bifunctional 4-hydroxy-2-oxoglutarate aldolase/2-dehydro-3-deoxy-phosphogluconate aldolase [Victivallaceae bacterium]